MNIAPDKRNSFICKSFISDLSEIDTSDSEVFQNVCCSDPFNRSKRFDYPIVVVNKQGVHLFLLLKSESNEIYGHETADTIDYMCRVFKDYFGVKRKFKTIFVLTQELANHSQPSFEKYRFSDFKLFTYIRNASLPQLYPISQEEALRMVVKGSEGDSETNENLYTEEYESIIFKLTKESSNCIYKENDTTSVFIKKQGNWLPAYEQDPIKTFHLALYGGFLGSHRFHLKMYGTGILYALTLGLCGVGWFFDCLEILLGAWHKKGRRLRPILNKKRYVVEFVLFFFIIIGTLTVLTIH